MRKLRTASALIATAAALTLGGVGLAAPASADGVGARATVGTAHSAPAFQGVPANLESDRTCTQIYSSVLLSARSAQNLPTSGTTITLYKSFNCAAPADIVATLDEGEQVTDLGALNAAVAYTST